MLSAFVGWGSSRDAFGANLPYGFVLSGKNVLGGLLGLSGGVQGTF